MSGKSIPAVDAPDVVNDVYVEFLVDYPWRGPVRKAGEIHVMPDVDADLLVKRGVAKITSKKPAKGKGNSDVTSGAAPKED